MISGCALLWSLRQYTKFMNGGDTYSLTLITHSLGAFFHVHNVIHMISGGWKLKQNLKIIKYVENYRIFIMYKVC